MLRFIITILLIIVSASIGFFSLNRSTKTIDSNKQTPTTSVTNNPVATAQQTSSTANTTAVITVRYPRVESAHDERHAYHIQLLRMALERTQDAYGPYHLEPSTEVMNEIHIMRKLEAGSDDIDVLFRPTSRADEERLKPLRIPLDKGLLGYRICLIRDEEKSLLANCKTLADLQKLRIGQGRDWNDVLVYQHNNIPVITGAIYEGLFEMLAKERFDVFPRGIQEAYVEYDDRHEQFPNLHVDSHLLIHYPFVRYIWLAKNPKGELLRERLNKGLLAIIADGTFDKLFDQRYGQDIKRAQLAQRHIIRINNPQLPDNIPLENKALWFNPMQASNAAP